MREVYKCPNCINEELIKTVGNLLVCRECDLTFIQTSEERPQPLYKREWVDEQADRP